VNTGSNREYLALEGTGLELDQTRRIVCPWCMGGESGEASMNLSRKPEGLAYNCHRASCGARGYLDGVPTVRFDYLGAAQRKERVYTGPVLPLTGDDYNYFEGAYELGEGDIAGTSCAAMMGATSCLYSGRERIEATCCASPGLELLSRSHGPASRPTCTCTTAASLHRLCITARMMDAVRWLL
jgi:hypothetical protein